MKKCPKCNRTYADDGFTFCLEDGALFVSADDVFHIIRCALSVERPEPRFR
jgi:hypothetical protein